VWQAVTCVVCGACSEVEDDAEALGCRSHDEALLFLRWCYTRGECRGTGAPRRRRGDEHAHALGSVAVGTPADGMNIVPTRHADSAGASSSISRGVAWLGKRAGLGRRSHLELKRGLHHKLNGVRLMFVERRRQSDDEW